MGCGRDYRRDKAFLTGLTGREMQSKRDKTFLTGLTGLTGKGMQREQDAGRGPDRTDYSLRNSGPPDIGGQGSNELFFNPVNPEPLAKLRLRIGSAKG
jgi:hypothetical protein